MYPVFVPLYITLTKHYYEDPAGCKTTTQLEAQLSRVEKSFDGVSLSENSESWAQRCTSGALFGNYEDLSTAKLPLTSMHKLSQVGKVS